MKLAKSICIFIGVAVFVCQPAKANERPVYFPSGTWALEKSTYSGSTIDYTEFYEELFGDQLFAMGEPSLADASATNEGGRHYRLLVLPSFTPATSVHISENLKGSFNVTTKVLNGAGGYEPGVVARRFQSVATDNQLTPLHDRLDKLGLWENALPPKKDVICADGTMYVIELAKENYFHALAVHECEITEDLEVLVMDFASFVKGFDPLVLNCFGPWTTCMRSAPFINSEANDIQR